MTLVTRGGGLTSVVDPQRGGKIISLVDDFGIEWLAQADPDATPGGASFIDAEMAGWDECAPSIAACTIGGVSVPDHGDLWDIPFGVEDQTLTAIGTSLGYRFERDISATEDGLLLSYRAETIGGSIPFLWAAHPQFVAPPGTRVELPVKEQLVVDVLDARLPLHRWSPELASIDTVPHAGTRKLYVDPERPAHGAHLVRGDGARLAIEWSRQCPYLGLWFDNAAISREPVIAIEPSTGYFDSLERAVASSSVAWLTPGRPLSWWVRLAVTHGRV